MTIVDFGVEHIAAARELAVEHFLEECTSVAALGDISFSPNMAIFAENKLGVAAIDGGKVVGFLCAVAPFDNAFGSTDARGVFSPMGTNSTVRENRAKIYAAMYQAAAEKWVRAGAVSHAICLFAHDEAAQIQFFKYGFGMRCVDAIRGLELIYCPSCVGYQFTELAPRDYVSAYPLAELLNGHFLSSPFFLI